MRSSFRKVDGHQGLIGVQEFVQAHSVAVRGQIVAVAQQQPAAALHHLPGGLVMAQAVGLVRADPVDGLPAVLRHHVEEVEDDLGVRALGPELLLEGGGHVHDHGVDPGTALGAQHVGEEGPDGLPGAADPDPQDLLAGGVDDDGGVAVALVQGELVDAPHRDVGEVHGLEAGGQGPFVHLLHGMPVDAVEGGPPGPPATSGRD